MIFIRVSLCMEVYWSHISMLVRQVLFGKIISQVFRAWFLEDMGMVLFDSILDAIKLHIHGFWLFLAHCIITMPFAAELSVFMGVSGFMWPILWRVILIVSFSWTLWKVILPLLKRMIPSHFPLCFILCVQCCLFLYCFWSFGTPWRSDLLIC